MRRMLPAIGCLALFCGNAAMAQAWLPSKGTVSAGITLGETFNRYHFLPDGSSLDVGHTTTTSASADVSWSPSSRWMLAATLPYVKAVFHGPGAHAGTNIDDGTTRGYLTDLRIDAHYQWRERPVALAPYVALVIPTHSYPSLGHAAPGRNLHERLLGIYVGRSLDYWLPRTYVQGRLQFGFVEPAGGVGHDRSNVDLELGHFLTRRWSVRLLGAWQKTHGGIDLPVPPTNPLYPWHDRLAREVYLQIGAGASFSPRPVDSYFFTYRRAVQGTNGHKMEHGLMFGYNYSLARRG